jgi:hypothetical protein
MTLIRPIVTLSVPDVNSLLVAERQVLRRICGPVQTEEGWRMINNYELEKLMRGGIIVKHVRAQRIKWWGHINRVGKTKTVRKIEKRNPVGMSSKGCPRNRWGDKVLNDLKKLRVMN